MSTSMNFNDLTKKSMVSCFNDFSRFRAVTHILRVNCAEMAGDGPRQCAYKIFIIKRRFYCCKLQPPRFKEGGIRGCQRRVPAKSGCFTTIGLCSMKTLADRCRCAVYHNEH